MRKPIGVTSPYRRRTDEKILKPFVIVAPHGLVHLGMFENEADAWRIFLGWPTVGEVKEHKAKGWYCTEATVTWQQPKEKK